MMKFYKVISLIIIGMTVSTFATAGIVITGTRVIYPKNEREVMVKLNNTGKKPVLMQAWIDNGDSTKGPESAEAPFTISPPVNRIDPDKGQTLKISYTGERLPEDKESVFWLNILEVPPLADSSSSNLQMAFRTRIKIFYRPTGLTGKPFEAVNLIKWKKDGAGVVGYNPSQYHVSIAYISSDKEGKTPISESGMIPPSGQTHFKLTGKQNEFYPVYINDNGGHKIVPSVVN